MTSARNFISHYQDFLTSIADTQESQGKTGLEILALARKRYASDRNLFSVWRKQNSNRDADLLDAIANIEIGRWVYLKDTRSYSVFLSEDGEAAYAVQGLTNRLRDISGRSGISVLAGVFALDGKYVCDGLLDGVVALGPNYMASFRECYQSLRSKGSFYGAPPKM